MIVNFADRAHNHNWELDPIVRSLLDTDFYKLLMLQFIWKHFRTTRVSFGLHNRNLKFRLCEMIHREEVIAQFEHVRRLRFRKSELIWLAGNTFYGSRGIFESAFLDWLENDFALSDYELSEEDGQFRLSFEGPWVAVTMWEIYALSILNELKTRAALKNMDEFELDILYAHAKTRLWGKIEKLRDVPSLAVADFGTRRRHSFLWQEYAVEAMHAELGKTSPAPPTPSSPTSTISKPSAPTRTRSPWPWRRCPPRTKSSKPRSTGCSNSGRRPTMERC